MVPQENDKGLTTSWNSPWFAAKITPDNTPRAPQRDGKAYREIAALEALGLLLALLAFGPGERLDNTALKVQVPAFTDNKGIGHVIDKLMTTRFPLRTVVMELAAQAELRGVRMDVEWTPREGNQEADDLSNLLTSTFDPRKEVKNNFERAKPAGPPAAHGSRSAVPRREIKRRRTAERRRTAREEKEEEGGQVEVQGKMVKYGPERVGSSFRLHCSPVFGLRSARFVVSFFAAEEDRFTARGAPVFAKTQFSGGTITSSASIFR